MSKGSALPHYKTVVIGEDSYHVSGALKRLADSGDVASAWLKGSNVSSVKLFGGGVVKSLDAFDKHNDTEEKFLTFLEECRKFDVVRPASYSEIFHTQFYSPRVGFSVNKYFKRRFAGAWQEAIQTGTFAQHLRKYDMNSAYLWAGSLGLPDTRGLDYDTRLKPNGLYLLEIIPKIGAPHPFDCNEYVVAETADIDLYGLSVNRVIGGVTWRKLTSGQQIVDAIQQFTFWRQIGRAYWGRWASRRGVRCKTFDIFGVRTDRELKNPFQNYLWANVIVNRVKRALYSCGAKPLHVFVDSIITADTLPISTKIGGWKLEDDYPTGLHIAGTGWYGVPGGKLIKHAGVSHLALLD